MHRLHSGQVQLEPAGISPRCFSQDNLQLLKFEIGYVDEQRRAALRLKWKRVAAALCCTLRRVLRAQRERSFTISSVF